MLKFHIVNNLSAVTCQIHNKYCVVSNVLLTSPIAAKVCSWSGDWLNRLSKKNFTDLFTYTNKKQVLLSNVGQMSIRNTTQGYVSLSRLIKWYFSRMQCNSIRKQVVLHTDDKSPVGCSTSSSIRQLKTYKGVISNINKKILK